MFVMKNHVLGKGMEICVWEREKCKYLSQVTQIDRLNAVTISCINVGLY